ADVALAAERQHVLEARALRDRDRWSKVSAVAVLVSDVLDEEHEQDVVLVLAGIHATAQLVTRGPERRVEVGFLDGHSWGLALVLVAIIIRLVIFDIHSHGIDVIAPD